MRGFKVVVFVYVLLIGMAIGSCVQRASAADRGMNRGGQSSGGNGATNFDWDYNSQYFEAVGTPPPSEDGSKPWEKPIDYKTDTAFHPNPCIIGPAGGLWCPKREENGSSQPAQK